MMLSTHLHIVPQYDNDDFGNTVFSYSTARVTRTVHDINKHKLDTGVERYDAPFYSRALGMINFLQACFQSSVC